MVLPGRAKPVKSNVVQPMAKQRVVHKLSDVNVPKSKRTSSVTLSSKTIIRFRLRRKQSAALIGVAPHLREPAAAPKQRHVLHLLLERRWLGLSDTQKRKSMGNIIYGKGMTNAWPSEGWAVRVVAVFQQKVNAEKALETRLGELTQAERDGGVREKVQLTVAAYEVDQLQGAALGQPVLENSSVQRRVYTVSTCVAEKFSIQDLPPGMAEMEGNYFFISGEHEEEAARLEVKRGSPWGYPHNAGLLCSSPGRVLKVFSSPVGESGANAYATGQCLKDLGVRGCTSLHNSYLEQVVSYSKEGLVRVRMTRTDKGESIRVMLTVNEYPILDQRTPRPSPTPVRAAVKKGAQPRNKKVIAKG